MQLKNERLVLFILGAVQFTHIVEFMVMMPLSNQLQKVFTITPAQFGYLVSSDTLSAGVTGFLGVFFLDTIDRKKALFWIYVGFLIGTISCAVSQTYIMLLLSRVITGGFGGLIAAMVLAIVGDVIPEHRRGKALGVVMTAFSLSAVFGVPFSLYLTQFFSWQAPFYFVSVLGLPVLLGILFMVPSISSHMNKNEKQSKLLPLKMIAKDDNVLLALAFTFVLMLGQFTIIPFIADYMESNAGFSRNEVMLMYTIGGGLTAIAMPVFGRLSDRFGKPKIFTIAGLLTAIPFYLVTHVVSSNVIVMLIISSLFFVLNSGRIVPATAMVTAVVTNKSRGGFMSLRSSIQALGMSFSAFLSGLIVYKNADGQLMNYHYVGYIAIFACILAVYLGRKLKMVNQTVG